MYGWLFLLGVIAICCILNSPFLGLGMDSPGSKVSRGFTTES